MNLETPEKKPCVRGLYDPIWIQLALNSSMFWSLLKSDFVPLGLILHYSAKHYLGLN